MHIDGDNRGALLGRKPHQCLPDDDSRLDTSCSIRYGEAVISEANDSKTVAAQTISAGVDDDTVQPAPNRGIVAKRTRATMGRQHGFLQGVGGVLGGVAASPRQPIQLGAVTVE